MGIKCWVCWVAEFIFNNSSVPVWKLEEEDFETKWKTKHATWISSSKVSWLLHSFSVLILLSECEIQVRKRTTCTSKSENNLKMQYLVAVPSFWRLLDPKIENCDTVNRGGGPRSCVVARMDTGVREILFIFRAVSCYYLGCVSKVVQSTTRNYLHLICRSPYLFATPCTFLQLSVNENLSQGSIWVNLGNVTTKNWFTLPCTTDSDR